MLRLIVTLTVALAASASFAQQRPYEVDTDRAGFELSLRDVIMPNGAAGTTIFKLCASCDSIGMPVHAGTRYAVAGQELALPEFLAAVEELRITTEGAAGVGVFYNLSTNRVSYIAVYPPR
jgi:hypothetical protein